MCLAVPGKLIQIRNEDGAALMGRVDFGGVVKEVCLSYLPEAKIGDYVMTHAGFAISRVEESEAREVFEMLAEIDQALGAGGDSGGASEGEVAAPAGSDSVPRAAEGAAAGGSALGDRPSSIAGSPGDSHPGAKSSDADALH